MSTMINAKQLRASLPDLVNRVRRGETFTVLYRSRPAFQMIPAETTPDVEGSLAEDPLYRARALGRSTDGADAARHDTVLYPR
ncbi:MAG TPA: hypothetical protein P5555_21335 [Candidatus Paceibacterota bacterium]|nr:hypothetical protein [Verrucomicrobiota bacterium]HOX04742.1 hypothetical protein [Verrucomicrobiota bacterium]HRZ47726.1 hypothetical protein [Candidatus Paceibacterota bacterium]